jgi:argininosuccinate lyase
LTTGGQFGGSQLAHLLMIESWVFSTAYLLPEAIHRLGHRFSLMTRDLGHYLNRPQAAGQVHPLLTADNIVKTETNDVAATVAIARRLHEVFRFDGVLTACDYYFDAVAAVAEALDLPGMRPGQVETARTKHLMRAALDRAGLPNVRWQLATDWNGAREAAARIGYPLVLKPVDLCASMFVSYVADEAELRAAYERLAAFGRNARQQQRPPRFLLEEYLVGEEVSVETCTYRDQTSVIGITDKVLAGFPGFIEVGHQFPAALDRPAADAATDLVVRALRAVGYSHGMGHVEVKLTADGPRIVEINPRVGGNYIFELIRLVSGLDTLGMLAQLAAGERPTLEPAETGIRSAGVRLLLPSRDGQVVDVRGLDSLEQDPRVVRWQVREVAGTEVRVPRDNNDYLGHVIAVDREGPGAGRYAAEAAARVELVYAEGAEAAPGDPPGADAVHELATRG